MTNSCCSEVMLGVIRHLDQLISDPEAPALPPELANLEAMRALHAKVLSLRESMAALLHGDLSREVSLHGYMAGLLKEHMGNLRHLTWQMDQVARGDFSQRVDFMGEFSKAFNSMIWQLSFNMTSLMDTEEALRELTDSLENEVALRTAALRALTQSEAHFKYLADHDALTGALNRRSFFNLAEDGLRSSQTRRSPCCIALLDIDFFKQVNDRYGHPIGDEVLRHVVSLGLSSLRQADSMGRYGGEEFIFFFSDADLEQGGHAAERIRAVIADNPARRGSSSLPVTVSLGVSVARPEWPGERDSVFLQKIISGADAALYLAKRNGRNQVCLAPEEAPGRSELGSE